MLKIFFKAFQAGIKTEKCEFKIIQQKIFNVFGRSLAIRHVDAGSCNMCELELQVLSNPFYNIEGYGIHFVSSPRHADVLVVTGSASRNMEEALKRTYDAMSHPKWVMAVGDCASGCGMFKESYACRGVISNVIPVNVTLAGCPPKPMDMLKGILNMIQSNL